MKSDTFLNILFLLSLSYSSRTDDTSDWVESLLDRIITESARIGCQLSMTPISSIHTIPSHPIRPTFNFTWEDSYEAVKQAGHHWCGLSKDNWACYGSHYTDQLTQTPHFNQSLGIFRLKKNSIIFVEGNSFLAERILYWACETSYIMKTHLNFRVPDSKLLVYKLSSDESNNDYLIHIPGPQNITLLLLDNDKCWNHNTSQTVSLLQSLSIFPSAIVLGHLNYIESENLHRSNRANVYKSAFSSVFVFPRPNLSGGCYANQCNSTGGGGHSCFPSKQLNEDTENLVTGLISSS